MVENKLSGLQVDRAEIYKERPRHRKAPGALLFGDWLAGKTPCWRLSTRALQCIADFRAVASVSFKIAVNRNSSVRPGARMPPGLRTAILGDALQPWLASH